MKMKSCIKNCTDTTYCRVNYCILIQASIRYLQSLIKNTDSLSIFIILTFTVFLRYSPLLSPLILYFTCHIARVPDTVNFPKGITNWINLTKIRTDIWIYLGKMKTPLSFRSPSRYHVHTGAIRKLSVTSFLRSKFHLKSNDLDIFVPPFMAQAPTRKFQDSKCKSDKQVRIFWWNSQESILLFFLQVGYSM